MIRALILLTLLLTSCTRTPEPPAPDPSPVPASPAPGPLFRLWLGEHPPDTDYLVAVLEAAGAWEDALGRPLFSWTDGKPVQLLQFPYIIREVQESAIGGVTFRDEGIVIFSGQVPIKYRRTVVLHEFGHLLGLSHSSDPWSVMYPKSGTQSITPDDTFRAIAVLSSK